MGASFVIKNDNSANVTIELPMAKAKDFDVAKYFDSPSAVAAYLNAALRTGDGVIVAQAFGVVARAKKISSVAKATGLNRENLYRSLRGGRTLALSTVLKLLDAFDVELDAKPSEKRQRRSRAARSVRKRRRLSG